jgi:hypothetical protein
VIRCGCLILSASLLALGISGVAPSAGRTAQSISEAASESHATPRLVAIGTQLIPRDKKSVVVFSGNHRVSLDYFTELLVATLADDKIDPDKLVGEMIFLERQLKQRDRWNVFTGGAASRLEGPDGMLLVGNACRVQKVLPSTAKNQVKVQVNGDVYRLRRGEVLFVLG